MDSKLIEIRIKDLHRSIEREFRQLYREMDALRQEVRASIAGVRDEVLEVRFPRAKR